MRTTHHIVLDRENGLYKCSIGGLFCEVKITRLEYSQKRRGLCRLG